MICAPVLIITLCRFEELKRCIASLKMNSYAKETDLYIGVDFPLKDTHKDGYNKIVNYLDEGIEGFSNVYIIKQTENKGWYHNFVSIRDKAYEKYSSFIYLEDDVEVSPNFLAYMNENLVCFEKDDDIQAICGYSYPFEWQDDGCNIVKINTYYTAWGYATWKRKENEMYRMITMEYFEKIMHSVPDMCRFYRASKNQFCNFVKGMIEYISVLVQNDEIVKLDMAFSIYIFMNQKYVVFPKISKTRNIGCNGQGMNCEKIKIDPCKPITSRNYDYATQPIDEKKDYQIIVKENLSFWEENNRILESFYPIEMRERIRTIGAYLIYLLIGRKRTRKLICRK